MITTLISDFSYVLLFPKDLRYKGRLNDLHKQLSQGGTYTILDHYLFNDELFTAYSEWKKKTGGSLFLYTDGQMHRIPELRQHLEPVFDALYCSDDVGYRKNNPLGYTALLAKIEKNPDEVLFIDDKDQNLEASKEAGLTTLKYISNTQTIQALR
ncbi:MAG: HAD-IA family hydrolase [Candidatus Pacebacteria bacterium]|nr:HAD-IA family hydrolase [Candidatus Paceibacterota bacterium]